MGVSGLNKALTPLRRPIDFGCTGHQEGQNDRDTPRWRAVIDGPSFVYWRYRILYRDSLASGALSPLDAMPSYDELVKDALDFLDACQKWSIDVIAIYFDTGLPDIKRSTREARLQAGISDLARLRQASPSGLQVRLASRHKTHQPRCSATESISPKAGSSIGAGVPAPPFIVSAVAEALAELASKDAKRHLGEMFVPGEADPWIAARARKESETASESTGNSNVVVLSDDSDLAIHDLGAAKLAQFSMLETIRCEQCGNVSTVLRGELFSQLEAKSAEGTPRSKKCRLDAHSMHDDWVKAAFLLSRRRSISGGRISGDLATLYKQVQAGQHDKLLNSDAKLRRAFECFKEEHAKYIDLENRQAAEGLLPLPAWQTGIDVRLNELVEQLLLRRQRPEDRQNDPEVNMYLPLLFESIDRSAAWSASRDIRTLAYQILIAKITNGGEAPSTIREYTRSGEKVHHTKIQCTQTSLEHCISRAQNLERGIELIYDTMRDQIHAIKGQRLSVALHANDDSSPSTNPRAVVWLIYATVRSYASYIQTAKPPPKSGTVNKAFRHAGRDENVVDTLDWPSAHFLATMHGFLYSLRMLVQALRVPEDVTAATAATAAAHIEGKGKEAGTREASAWPILSQLPRTIGELMPSLRSMPSGVYFHQQKGLDEAARRFLDFAAQTHEEEDDDGGNGGLSDEMNDNGEGDVARTDVVKAMTGDDGNNNNDDDDDNEEDDDTEGTPGAAGSRFAALLGRRWLRH